MLFYHIQVLEQSSEIASARSASNYKISVKQRIRKNAILIGASRNLTLSKISEEDSDENFGREKLKGVNKVTGNSSTDEEKISRDSSSHQVDENTEKKN